MGREPNDDQNELELDHPESSTIDTIPIDPIQSELTSPWPDQWRLEELGNDMIDSEDPWPDTEGTNKRNNESDTKELDWTNDTPDATPWGLVGEPRRITEQSNAVEPEPEEELSPQTSNKIPDQKETSSLQNDQRDQEI